MISKISFGSTYNIKNTNDATKNQSLKKFCSLLQDGICKASIVEKSTDDNGEEFPSTIVVKNSADVLLEQFCAVYGIKYTKTSDRELLNPSNIKSRIILPKEGYRLVEVDNNEFLKLINQSQNSTNYWDTSRNYDVSSYTALIELKSGKEIEASTLEILPKNPQDEINKRTGADINLGENGDMFIALSRVGMKKIPAYVDEESYETGVKLGLFKKPLIDKNEDDLI